MAEDNIIEFNPTVEDIATDINNNPTLPVEQEIKSFQDLLENQEINSALSTSIDKIKEETGIEIPQETLLIISTLFALPEDVFGQIAPSFLTSFEESFNSQSERYALCESLNLSKVRTEDLILASEQWNYAVDNNLSLGFSEQKRDFLKRIYGIVIDIAIECKGVANKVVRIPFEKCDDNAQIPTYANDSDAGADIYAIEEVIINPGETKLVRTGLKLAIPKGYEIQIRPRSGLSARSKLRIANTPGTIDSGYRDEICVVCENIEPQIKDIHYHFDNMGRPIIDGIDHGSPITIGKGERIAQMILGEVPKISFYEGKISNEENRGGGFGSTGV